MENLIKEMIAKKELDDFKAFVALLSAKKEKLLTKNDIILEFYRYCDIHGKSSYFRSRSSIYLFFIKVQEMLFESEHIYLMHRYDIAVTHYYRLSESNKCLEVIPVSRYIDLKEQLFLGSTTDGRKGTRIDFLPFYDYAPSLQDNRSIGNGIRYLNRYMSSKIFQNPTEWHNKLFGFIKLHKDNGRQLLVNGAVIGDFETMKKRLEKIMRQLRKRNPEAPYAAVKSFLRQAGFEVGWGNTVGRILETMQMLIDLTNEPTDSLLEHFISHVPMPLISKLAILSPHGWFGQENVLGRPDTGGQVIYILDQVRSLEKYLQEEIRLTGLDVKPKIVIVTRLIPDAEDTTCDQEREQIAGTDNVWIQRIPFRDRNNKIVRPWISRFHIWPYLEKFAEDTAEELKREFGGRPDLVIGNYSDGNLVATLLSEKLDVVLCTIAHALEKTKYQFSDLLWQQMEQDYCFSLKYVADILAMNKSDFIITSTFQEIAGTEETIGQYESYQSFTMPGLMNVVNGLNLYAPKFNVIPPGISEDLYFPYNSVEQSRSEDRLNRLKNRLFLDEDEHIVGFLINPDRTPIFTMSRLDHIKNISGLVEAFGMSEKLRKKCNLIISGGSTHLENSRDTEEQQEIKKIYQLIEVYNLSGSIRWLPATLHSDTGETYRVIADRRGIFVQPALFEAFGLTIVEAMACGLPTFATVFGGPSEIIEFGVSGFLLNTSKPELIAASLEKFFDRCSKEPGLWQTISQNGINRVREGFNWKIYSKRLVNLTKLYGFWRYSVAGEGKIKMDRYRELIYHFLFRQRI